MGTLLDWYRPGGLNDPTRCERDDRVDRLVWLDAEPGEVSVGRCIPDRAMGLSMI